MANGAKVRTIEELKKNSNIKTIIRYYNSGQLETWCRAYGYDFLNKLQRDNDYQTLLNICSELNIEIIDIEDYIFNCEVQGELVKFGSVSGVKYIDNSGKPICVKLVEDSEKRIPIQWVKIAEKEDKVLLLSQVDYPSLQQFHYRQINKDTI